MSRRLPLAGWVPGDPEEQHVGDAVLALGDLHAVPAARRKRLAHLEEILKFSSNPVARYNARREYMELTEPARRSWGGAE